MTFLDYQPRGVARELFRRRDPEVVLSGPAGTGKSRGVLEKVHACAEKYPGSRHLMVRKTRASLTSTGLITFEKNVLPPGAAEINYQQARYPNESVIVFGGMDKSSKIMSSEYDTIYVQEATELTEGDWEDLTTRLRWGRMPYQQMLADCNPGPPSHWLKRRANDGRTLMLESRHEDNPTLWTGSEWTGRGKDYLAKLDALSGARQKRLRHGIWAAAEGMVYDRYDPAVHLIPRFDVPAEWPRVWSIDFGFTNPFVWQVWAMDPDGRLYRILEIYKTQTLVEDHALMIRRVCKEHKEPRPVVVICDHDAEDRATLERHLGHIIGPTQPAFKSISPGIQAVQRRLRKAEDGKPRLMLLRDSLVERDAALDDIRRPCCTEEEIEGYVWPQAGAGRTTDLPPVKKDDHGMDGMRYTVACVDGVQIDPSEERTFHVTERPSEYLFAGHF